MFTFRPHHFFCTLGFQGKGYSKGFVDNFSQIKNDLTEETLITVTSKTDDICSPCPHRCSDVCATQQKIEKLDQAHAKALDLKEGGRVTWREAQKRLAQLTLQDHKNICQECQWLNLGLCSDSLEKLKNSLL